MASVSYSEPQRQGTVDYRPRAAWLIIVVLFAAPLARRAPLETSQARVGRASELALPPLSLNALGVDELRLLPGIGPSLAQRIVADRDKRGPFDSMDALTRVPGIGPKTVDRLTPFVSVEAEGGVPSVRPGGKGPRPHRP